jgi:hypothetical protein
VPEMSSRVQLVRPALNYLPGYIAALKRGWSPDNVKGAAAAIEELAEIDKDPHAFIDQLIDRDAKGRSVVLPDGSSAPRIPGYRLWLWDGEFCGSIGWVRSRALENGAGLR